MLSSIFMHLIGLALAFDGQKVVTLTVFWTRKILSGISLLVSNGQLGVAKWVVIRLYYT